MKQIALIAAFLYSTCAMAQDVKLLQETARNFMMQADYPNAILVLNRALAIDANNYNIAKDLTLNYYLSGNFEKAYEIAKPLLDKDDADDQIFQIAGDILLAQTNTKECEKVYKKGLKKFASSGPLYNAYGELLFAQKDYSAIKQWEKGIETDPSYSRNYYNASRYYYFTTDKVWSIIYGEIFANMEPSGKQTPEIKTILFEGYKKLFVETDLTKATTEKNEFVKAYLQIMNKQTMLVSNGITTEALVMIRTRFILDWFNEFAEKFPFRLFEQQRQLIQEGFFDAYNHWIFTATQNLSTYQNWINLNSTIYNDFTRFQKGRIFKIPTGQYYH
jgi:tetratricopeptide (TPR) repeat protein